MSTHESVSTHESAVVVGVDGSPQSAAALAFALAEAERCGDTLHVVTAWNLGAYAVGLPLVPVPPLPPDAAELERSARQVLGDMLAAAGATAVPVVEHVVEGDTGPVLVELAADARLLVVGTRGLGGLRAALLGSVSRYCARHATCPVVVVPGPHEPAREDTHGHTHEHTHEHPARPADAGSPVLTPLY